MGFVATDALSPSQGIVLLYKPPEHLVDPNNTTPQVTVPEQVTRDLGTLKCQYENGVLTLEEFIKMSENVLSSPPTSSIASSLDSRPDAEDIDRIGLAMADDESNKGAKTPPANKKGRPPSISN